MGRGAGVNGVLSEYAGPVTWLVTAFGPIGAAFALVAGILGYFYRRDFLRKIAGLRNAHERRDVREERLLSIVERQAAASEALVLTIAKLDETLIEHHRFATAWADRLTTQVGEIGHDVKNVLDRLPWRGA